LAKEKPETQIKLLWHQKKRQKIWSTNLQ
jgi:hypothetical protein